MSSEEEKKSESKKPAPAELASIPHAPPLTRGRTFSSQSTLPRLPIPSLEETLDRFPRAVWAVQNQAQRAETRRVVDEFLNGDGPELQSMLEKYEKEGRKNGTIGSYVEEFWTDAYLAPDTSVVLNLNPFFLLEDGPDAKLAKDQVGRAASLVFASAKMASLLRTENLAPDVFKGRALCMDQYKALFGSYRVPKQSTKDCVLVDPDSQHIVVLARNQFYYFTALWPDGTVAVNEADIKEILNAILSDADNFDPEQTVKQALGVLTTQSRDTWAVTRDNIAASSEHNAAALEIIDSALFVLALDDFTPKDVHEAVSNMLHGTYRLESKKDNLQCFQAGTCCNRWYDKLQIIVCADGSAGVNFEHSSIDGHTALRFASDVFAETVVSFAQSITKLIHGKGSIPDVISANVRRAAVMPKEDGDPCLDTSPKRLEFDIPGSVVDKIFYAETALGDDIVSTDTHALEFKNYGKNFITGNKMSPDSLVQMSMLLAYYRLFGKVVCAYEPVLTKQFYHGRTEAMRSATPKAAALCETWTNRFTSKEEKLKALRDAAQEHSTLVREAASGKGVDRHLFALKCIAEKNGVKKPAFFESEAWNALNHTVLSTSNCGNPALRHFGFGPVVPDGFGIGYIIKDGGLQYSISSKHRQTKRYAQMLHKTLLDFEDIMQPLSSVEVAHGCYAERKKLRKESAVEYAEGIDYFGELDGTTTPTLMDTGARRSVRKETGKYLGRVFKRQTSITEDTLKKVGKMLDGMNLAGSIKEGIKDVHMHEEYLG